MKADKNMRVHYTLTEAGKFWLTYIGALAFAAALAYSRFGG